MKRWIETSFLRAASLILIWGSLNLVLLSLKDLHSSTSSELVMGLDLQPGFEVLRYQTPSVLLNIKEFLLFLSSGCVVKPSDVCHACQHTDSPRRLVFSVVPVSIRVVRLAWSPVGAPGQLSGSPFSQKWCPSGLDYQECVGGEAVRQQSKIKRGTISSAIVFFITAKSRVERRAFPSMLCIQRSKRGVITRVEHVTNKTAREVHMSEKNKIWLTNKIRLNLFIDVFALEADLPQKWC